MKKNSLLLVSTFAVLLAGTAGYAVDPSKCKDLNVSNVANYYIRVIYKNCLTGKVETEKVTDWNASFKLDPTINSDKELRIEGVWLSPEYLWHSSTAGNGFNVICEGSVATPECRSIPINPSNCKTLHVDNSKASYTSLVSYEGCGTSSRQQSRLRGGESLSYAVQPNTGIHIDQVAGGRIFPKSVDEWNIGNGYNFTCSGLAGSPSCQGKPITGKK